MAGDRFNIKMPSYQYRIPIIKIRRSCDRLIFIIGIPIPGEMGVPQGFALCPVPV